MREVKIILVLFNALRTAKKDFKRRAMGFGFTASERRSEPDTRYASKEFSNGMKKECPTDGK